MKVEFYKHSLSPKDIQNAVRVLRSTFLTTGEEVSSFENKFSQYLGIPYTVGLTSCTAALHLALLAHNIGPGCEVITTPMTFIASANSIKHTGATPVFVDVERETGNINADLIVSAITPHTKAILPVHLYGQMCDMRKIRRIADSHKLVIIEDSAHAIEAVRDGIRPGHLGDAACFSFYATKNLTSGEGGALSTKSASIADQVRMLRLHGMNKGAEDRYYKKYQHWDMEILGWKYNMDNIHAALLVDQIDRLDAMWEKRERICKKYEDAFSSVKGIDLLKVPPGSKSSRQVFTILVDPEGRDLFMEKLQEKGIGVAVNFRAIHLLTYYRNTFGYKRGNYPFAESIGDRTITLPLYPKLKDREVDYVIESVIKIASEINGRR